MFGWFRKRKRNDETAVDTAAEQSVERAAAGQPGATAPQAAPAQSPAAPADEPAPADRSPASQPPAAAAPQQPPADAAAAVTAQAADRGTTQQAAHAPASSVHAPVTAPPVRASSLPIAAPSLRPAMPLSDNPNFAGLGLAQPDHTPPRLLEPEAALTDDARDELTAMLLDMFGPTGRYRLEWRANREPGDDAMFSEIMVADLVRRIQNSIAVASDLELRAAPLRLAIEAMHQRRTGGDDPNDSKADADADASDDADAEGHESAANGADAEPADADVDRVAADSDASDDRPTTHGAAPVEQTAGEQARAAAIAEFVTPAPSLHDLAAAAEPPRPHLGMRDTADRRIA
ncbi:hypothetical protein GCM10011490_13980 [Pseudoclavibacter endophyticus]|uniref:hypothetical protein n=1 Tax=Pseudoclavibacter endophyticus TaxID=1778590 RepID=UPI0016681E83|nr:hypothetical protein [Pseudoclavibacter endophyticus]GGA64544.1 hypothetical protein GCM10011490_13980 [Pseudoclavibacter endophyticus]